jgi:FkbM family methyltransferase
VNIEDILKHVTRAGDTILDIGGYVGNVAWFMTTCVGPDGKVFSFEPHPELFKALHAKAEKYSNLTAFNLAVSNAASPVTLYFGMTEASNQASTIRADLVTTDLLGDDIRSVEVPAVTLDRFCVDHGLHPSVIKIDVEGAEPFVLAGAGTVLETMPLLIFEMGVTKKLPDHVAKLRAQGYQLYFVDIHRFVSEPPSWDHTESTETRALRNCIISFTDADAENITPYLSNILAVCPEKHARRLAGLRIVTIAEALPYFADPKRLRSRQIKRLVRRVMIPAVIENRFPGVVVCLRKIANLIL